MRSLTKTGIRILSAKYRSILIKCAIINASVFIGMVGGVQNAMADSWYANNWTDYKNAINNEVQGHSNIDKVYVQAFEANGITYEDLTNNISRTLSIDGLNKYLDGNEEYQGLVVDADGNLTLTNITMKNFKATQQGGAIENYGTANIIGAFIGNLVESDTTALGGAIYNDGNITNIKGNFTDNSISSVSTAGGAIYNKGSITNIEGNFKDTNLSSTGTASGGVIYNIGNIDRIKGDFIDNSASGMYGSGGGIFNLGTISIFSGNFVNNSVSATFGFVPPKGGAIYNGAQNTIINILADNGELKFDGNYVTSSSGQGGAIYNTGTVGLYAQTASDSITFTGTSAVTGAYDVDGIYNTGTLNINGSGTITPYAGTVNLYNVDGTGTTNIYGGIVNVAKDLTQKTVSIAENATLTTKDNVTTTSGITNAGTLDLTGTSAVVNSVINGENGITNFGDGTNNAYIEVQKAISQAINIQNGAWVVANADMGLTGKAFNIEENAALDIAADNIKADIVNKSFELIINDGIDHTSGIISTKITGDGATTLTGKDFFIAENGLIDQDLHLSGTLTTNADKLGDGHQIVRSYGDFPAIVNLTGGILKGSIIGPKTTITDGSSVGIANDYYIGNLVLGNNSTLNQKNNSTGVLNIGILDLTSDNNLMLDADLAGEKMDQLSVMEISGSNTLKISDIQLLSDANDNYTELSLFADGTTTDVYNKVSGNLNGLKYSPIYKYDALYDQTTGKIGFTRYESGTSDDFNPYIYTPSVVANTTAAMTAQIATLAMDKMDDVVHTQGRSGGDTPTSSNVWVKVMGLNDNVKFNNFENVDSKAMTVTAGYNTNKITCGDCDIVFGAYAGYIGGKQHYTANDIDQNGGYVGLSSALTLGNAFLTATVNGGLLKNKANNMYGSDRFNTLWLGTGLKAGYNYAITDSVVLQPNVYGGYTLVNTKDYTSVSGVKIATNNLNFFEIDPGLKLSAVIADGWTGSVQGKYAIVMDNGADITANDFALQNISTKNYIEYGIGIDKSVTDAFYLGAKINRHDGGRTGWNGSIEFRYKF